MVEEDNGWSDYHKIQYERMYQHESQRLIFSNMMLGISAFIITFGFKVITLDSLPQNILSLVIVVIVNCSAVIFINESRYWVKLHQKRAEKIRAKFSPELQDVVEKIEKKDTDLNKFGRVKIQTYIHKSIIIASILYVSIESYKYIGV